MNRFPSPFSPTQLTYLERLIDDRVRAALEPKEPDEPAAPRRFLSVGSIRRVLLERLPELYREFGIERPFSVAALRHKVGTWLELSEADLEQTPGGSVPRWEAQLHNAIHPDLWEDSPFDKVGRRGHWQLIAKPAPTQATLAGL
jgi:hypothetical protein